ncbi:carboxypeptidase-like regulatory domain-containing protein [Hymenobacter sp. BT770]|uniref:carboxypeptidase-like regulatory domain-containing protein n=1 Tax=Hymenobacter sp. BT770 TaxID=2886942 RepID=UPI001D0F6983|nr:carboxypeptidase-like regulatory domain-containing protein [Hymenobacter sp. BT770]MCC3153703.1 carboxypeptidase-like regulatory domain-containing protein [Hymenobacter sp. BT770]
MATSPTITVPQPCNQSWTAMNPTEAGRHCAACQKTVVDFSLKTREEILAYLAQPGQENSCGRFRSSPQRAPARLLTWSAAPWAALSLAAVLTLTHCTPDASSPSPADVQATILPDAQLVSGRVLDRDTQQPLAGALIICEKDTLCQTRTAADGSFRLAVPKRLSASKLIAVLPGRPQVRQNEEDWLMPYIPHYFTAGHDVTVLLRRPPMILGETKLEAGETRTPAVLGYLMRQGAVPPPFPKIVDIEFQAPKTKP